MTLPILPARVDVATIPLNEDTDVLMMNLSTDVVSAMFSLRRSQVIELGAKLLQAGERMKRKPQDAKLTKVRRRLIVPGEGE